MQRTTPSLVRPGLTGRPSLILAATARRRSRAINAAAVADAGTEAWSMSHIPNTKILKIHEQWARAQGYRNNQQASKQASTVDQRARSTDKQAKPSSNRQASMDPGTSFKHPWPRCLIKIKEFCGCLEWNEIWCGENVTKLRRVTFNSTVKKCPFLLYPNRSGTPAEAQDSSLVHEIPGVFCLTSCQNLDSNFLAISK